MESISATLKKNKLLSFGLFVAIALGLYARLLNLGLWELAVDEFYTTRSILNILETGLPQFNCGGYYTRGLLQQYLTAPLIALFDDLEFSARLIPAITNIACLPLVFLIARRCGDSTAAFICTALFSLSIFEIEYARFARMYAPFQLCFLLQFYWLIKLSEDKEEHLFYPMLSLAAFTTFIYAGSIFLCLLCLIPFFTNSINKQFYLKLILLLLCLAAVLFYQTLDARHMGAQPHLPLDYLQYDLPVESKLPLPIHLPDFMFYKYDLGFWIIIFLVPVVVFSFALTQYVRYGYYRDVGQALIIILPVFAALHQATLVIISFILLQLLNLNQWRFSRIRGANNTGFLVLLSTTLFLLCWVIFASTLDISLRKIAVYLLKYPGLITDLEILWFGTIPAESAFIFVLMAFGAVHAVLKSQPLRLVHSNRHLLFFTVITCLLIEACLMTRYQTLRYTFFLYPLLIIASWVSLNLVFRYFRLKESRVPIANIAAFFLFFVIAEMYSLDHLLNISSPRINFRTEYSKEFKDIYYPRMEALSSSEHINKHAAKEDTVLTTLPRAAMYLDMEHYSFSTIHSNEFKGISSCYGEKHIWTNMDLLFTKEQVISVIASSKNSTWILIRSELYPYRTETEKYLATEYAENVVYTSLDRNIKVLLIPAKV